MATTDSYLDRVKTKPTVISPIQLPGDRAQELARAAAVYTPVATNLGAVPVDGSTSGNSGDVTQQSLYQQMLDKLANQQPYNAAEFPGYTNPTMSAAQRAALAVNGKYSAQQSALNRSQAKNDQNLAVGQATQTNYGQIGDTKLAAVYGDLTKVAQETAGKTQQLYADAKTGVDNSYQTAAQQQVQNAGQVNSDVAATANQLGLQSAITDATKNLTSYQATAQGQLAADRANGVANIITLGADMGAAALKDVNIMAQLGADSRRDLVNSVQNTISTLQYQHDQTSADLQAQLADLETQRQSDLQAATYQYEADDADKLFKYQQAKAQYDAENAQNAIGLQHQNLTDMLSILKAQQDEIESNAGIAATSRGQDQADTKFNYEKSQQELKNSLDFKQYGLDYDKFLADEKDKGIDNARLQAQQDEDIRHQKAVDTLNADKSRTDIQKEADRQAETERHNKAAEVITAGNLAINAGKLATSTAKAAQDKLKDDAYIKNLDARTQLTQQKLDATVNSSGYNVKGLKDEPGLQTFATQAKLSPTDITNIRALKSLVTNPNPTTITDPTEYNNLLLNPSNAYAIAQSKIDAKVASGQISAELGDKYRIGLAVLFGKA